jgi:hypothetical protein
MQVAMIADDIPTDDIRKVQPEKTSLSWLDDWTASLLDPLARLHIVGCFLDVAFCGVLESAVNAWDGRFSARLTGAMPRTYRS